MSWVCFKRLALTPNNSLSRCDSPFLALVDVRDARNYTALDIAQEAGDENQPIISYLSHVMGVTSSSGMLST